MSELSPVEEALCEVMTLLKFEDTTIISPVAGIFLQVLNNCSCNFRSSSSSCFCSFASLTLAAVSVVEGPGAIRTKLLLVSTGTDFLTGELTVGIT